MNKFVSIICILLSFGSVLSASSNTFLDYQNYNHGYCPDCNCYPCKCAGNAPDPAYPQDEEDPPPPTPCREKGNTCPKPDPCCPAPVCATQCGISLWTLGIVIAGVATAAAIIIGSNNGKVAHSAP